MVPGVIDIAHHVAGVVIIGTDAHITIAPYPHVLGESGTAAVAESDIGRYIVGIDLQQRSLYAQPVMVAAVSNNAILLPVLKQNSAGSPGWFHRYLPARFPLMHILRESATVAITESDIVAVIHRIHLQQRSLNTQSVMIGAALPHNAILLPVLDGNSTVPKGSVHRCRYSRSAGW